MPDDKKLEQVLVKRLDPRAAEMLNNRWGELKKSRIRQEQMIDPPPFRSIHDILVNMPPVPEQPWQFRMDAEPFVGNSTVQKMVRELIQATGNNFPKVNGIRVGPTQGVIEEFGEQGDRGGPKISPYDYDDTNLGGLHDRQRKEISLNPRYARGIGAYSPDYLDIPELADLNDDELFRILVHELTHAAGGTEATADDVGIRALNLRGRKYKETK